MSWIFHIQNEHCYPFVGIFEATSLDRSKKSPLETHELSNGVFHNQLPISELPSWRIYDLDEWDALKKLRVYLSMNFLITYLLWLRLRWKLILDNMFQEWTVTSWVVTRSIDCGRISPWHVYIVPQPTDFNPLFPILVPQLRHGEWLRLHTSSQWFDSLCEGFEPDRKHGCFFDLPMCLCDPPFLLATCILYMSTTPSRCVSIFPLQILQLSQHPVSLLG